MSSSATGVGMPICFLGAILLILTQKSSQKFGDVLGISERPKEVDGVRFGDFEMDTIVGKGNCGAIVTLVEKQTNMLFMRKLKHGKNAKKLAETVKQLLMPFFYLCTRKQV